jgi:2-polyprenyl-3-methyl-5-hydroxy-6-metoxy-1,4-benzoquinol methylase
MMWKDDELEHVACDLCGATDAVPVIVRPDKMQVVKCARCGLVFLNPRPKPHLIPRLYQRDYFSKSEGSATDCGYEDYLSNDHRLAMRRQAKYRMNAIRQLVREVPKRSLEVGCATGEFCGELVSHGSIPTGIDLSDFAISEARKRFPTIDFREGEMESLSDEEKFDTVYAFELIEHVLSPMRFFDMAGRLLAPGGYLIFTTPNVNCSLYVGEESGWLGYVSSFEHLYFLSPEIMAEYCRRTEFSVVQWMTTGSGLPMKPDVGRSFVRNTLRRTGLLSAARAVRDSIRDVITEPGLGYLPGGYGHNLLIVCRKST